MRDVKDKQHAEYLAMRLREMGSTSTDLPLSVEEAELLGAAAGYLLALSLRLDSFELAILSRDVPPHCDTCKCYEYPEDEDDG